MRAIVARQLRRLVYHPEASPRSRRYYRLRTGACVADDLRRRYQAAKNYFKGLPWTAKNS